MKTFMTQDFEINKIAVAVKVVRGSAQRYHPHRPFHGLAMFFHEAEFHFWETQRIFVHPGEIIYMPKHSRYTTDSIEPKDCFAINFDFTNEISINPFIFTPKNPQIYLTLFNKAIHNWEVKPKGYNAKCKSELYNIIYHMQNEYFETNNQYGNVSTIMPAIEYIHKNYTSENISIPDLAQMCNISEVYLRRIFKNRFTTSPIKYINNLKIERAKELMDSGMNFTVTEIAEQCGFIDMSHFSRLFKKVTDMSPVEYMKKK